MRLWLRWKWSEFREWLPRFIVWRLLPRRVVYWSAIRVIAHATQGPWSNQIVPDLRAMDALDRWERTT